MRPALRAACRSVVAWSMAMSRWLSGIVYHVDLPLWLFLAALKAGRIPGPYVVVGVSIGGLDSLLLADREPSKVAGMVLVDPSFPDQSRRLQRAAPEVMAWGDSNPPPFIALLIKCMAALRAGTLRPGGADPDGCLRQEFPPSYPLELRAALEKARAEATPEEIASAMEGMHSEPSATIAINPDRNYGGMPLIVLTAGINEGGGDLPPDLKAQVPLVAAEWRRANEELATLSTRGVWRLVPDSSHDIPGTKPQVVIDAIDEVVDAVRAARPAKVRTGSAQRTGPGG